MNDMKNYVVENTETGLLEYIGDTFIIRMNRYSDPQRLNLARNAAIYLGKKDRDNIRRPLRIVKDGHVPAIFRGEMVEFEFIDVSKEVYDHIITYTTANMRATGGNRALISNDFTMPSDKMKQEGLVELAVQGSMMNYQNLIQAKETKQVARSAMPIAARMNPFVFQFNFVTLGESIFRQRLWEKGAQGNTVKVVQGMFELCKAIDPDLWNTFYEYKGEPALQWEEVRKKLTKEHLTIQQFMQELESIDLGQNGDKSIVSYLTERSGGMKSMW